VILVITGTGTGVGKTIVTAALAALARDRGARVAVVKPAQTGLASGSSGSTASTEEPEESDLEVVRRLSGVTDLHELARYPDPLSPEAAARRSGLPPLDLGVATAYIGKLAADLVLVEGAGGLLVRYDPSGWTIADLAAAVGAPVVVVTTPGLGTLNHTALTLEALAARGLTLAGLVIGSWPAAPGLAELSNLTDLPPLGGQALPGRMPAGAGQLSCHSFLAAARLAMINVDYLNNHDLSPADTRA
jgi:dethiobiotin synthetase